MKTLITYGSRYGSTEHYAKNFAASMTDKSEGGAKCAIY